MDSRQRGVQEPVPQAEDRSVGADAEREREHRDGGEAGSRQKRAQRVAQILEHGVRSSGPRTPRDFGTAYTVGIRSPAGLVMNSRLLPTLAALAMIGLGRAPAPAQVRSETVVVHNGTVALHGLLFRPPGGGPFPAILLNHGSGRTPEELARFGPYEQNAETLGPVFARHGYVFLYLFRRGVGPYADQGKRCVDLMTAEQDDQGLESRITL